MGRNTLTRGLAAALAGLALVLTTAAGCGPSEDQAPQDQQQQQQGDDGGDEGGEQEDDD